MGGRLVPGTVWARAVNRAGFTPSKSMITRPVGRVNLLLYSTSPTVIAEAVRKMKTENRTCGIIRVPPKARTRLENSVECLQRGHSGSLSLNMQPHISQHTSMAASSFAVMSTVMCPGPGSRQRPLPIIANPGGGL